MKKFSRKKILLSALLVFGIGLILFAAITIYQIRNPQTLFSKSTYNNTPKQTATPTPSITKSTPKAENKVQPTPENNEGNGFASNRVNVLLLGFDESPERLDTMRVFRTDTIMLATIDFDSRDVYVLSIPRDSYVEIPGVDGMHKINEAFNKGGSFNGKGFEKVMETVSSFIGGISIDYYMGVDMQVFKTVIDKIGGVEYDVDVPTVMCGRTLEPGLQLLTGQQVLDYCRNRNTAKADIDRIDRQQRILLATFEQLKEKAKLTQIPDIYLSVKDDVFSNMNLKQIAGLALFGSNIDFDSIHRYYVPGGFLTLETGSYWGIKQNEKAKIIKEIFGIDIPVNEQEDIEFFRKQEEERKLQQAIQQETPEDNPEEPDGQGNPEGEQQEQPAG